MRQCKVMHVSAVYAHYTLHTYAILHLLCDRFVFGFLCSWHFNFSASWSVLLSLMASNTNFTILDTLFFVNPWRLGRFVAGGLWGESLLHLFVALLAELLVASGEVITSCWWEAALVMAPVWGDLWGSFLAADLLFRWLIVSNNLFYYQRVALGYVYCCACVILIYCTCLVRTIALLDNWSFLFWLIACLHECNVNYV